MEDESQYALQLVRMMEQHTVALSLVALEEGQIWQRPEGFGSGLFAAHGGGAYLLTCHHVMAGLQRIIRREAKWSICCEMGGFGYRLLPAPSTVWDDWLDIAILEHPVLVPLHEGPPTFSFWAFHLELPICRPVVGELALVCGYPGQLRGPDELGSFTVLVDVESVSETQCVLVPAGPKTPIAGTNYTDVTEMGGLSGCPVYVLRGYELNFIGLVKEGSGDDDPIFVTLLDHLESGLAVDWLRLASARVKRDPRRESESAGAALSESLLRKLAREIAKTSE